MLVFPSIRLLIIAGMIGLMPGPCKAYLDALPGAGFRAGTVF
jgi:hypothetical protein